MTVLFHFDALMLAHARINMVTEHVKLIDKVYGTTDPLVATKVKIHEHLVMTLDFVLKLGAAMTHYD